MTTSRTGSIWLRPERATRGPAPEHDRAGLAAAAVTLADQDGLPTVTMRRLADAVGAGKASLYRYVQGHDEVLELMADHVAGELDRDLPRTGDWRRDLVSLAGDVRRVYYRHPWVLDTPLGGPGPGIGPNGLDHVEYALSLLAGLDVPGSRKLAAVALLYRLVGSFVRTEVAVGGSTAAWAAARAGFVRTVATTSRHPHLSAAVVDLEGGPAGPGDPPDELVVQLLVGMLTAEV